MIGNDTATPKRRVRVEGCRAHPDAALGNGRDVAFCLLAESITDVPAVLLLEDAEQELVRVGTPVTQIGFGLDTDEGVFGVKRRTTAEVQRLGDDLVIAGTTGGTCEGDSGGPALVRLADLDPALPSEWRLLGLLSAGTSFDCEVSTDHYSNIRGVRSWIESESGVDLLGEGTKRPMPDGEQDAGSAGCQISGRRNDECLAFVIVQLVALSLAARRRRVGG